MSHKIIFTGQVGAGKTTAIGAISDIEVVRTEAVTDDEDARNKETTTVAMDYGILRLNDGEKVHLYGTPGQERFSFMWNILTSGGLGLVVLIDNARENPVDEMQFYLDSFRSFIGKTAVAIGITRMDVSPAPRLSEYHARLQAMGLNPPLFEVDARKSNDVKTLVLSLLRVLETR